MVETRESSLDDARLEKGVLAEAEWKPGRKEYAVIITLSVVSLMVALDATILVSVLPVSGHLLTKSSTTEFQLISPDIGRRTWRHRNRCVLGRDILPSDISRLSTLHRCLVRHFWAERDAHHVHLLVYAGHPSVCTHSQNLRCLLRRPVRPGHRWRRYHHPEPSYLCRYCSPPPAAQVLWVGPNFMGIGKRARTVDWWFIR